MITPERKAKINWQCRRGMLELDLMLQRFSRSKIDNLSEEELGLFERILEVPDPDLYAWLMGYEKPTDKEFETIVAYIRLYDHPSSIK